MNLSDPVRAIAQNPMNIWPRLVAGRIDARQTGQPVERRTGI